MKIVLIFFFFSAGECLDQLSICMIVRGPGRSPSTSALHLPSPAKKVQMGDRDGIEVEEEQDK